MIKKYFFLFLFISCASVKEQRVYICKSNHAKKYHYSDICDGLNNCKHELSGVSIEEAKKLGYVLCDFENGKE